MCFNSFLIVQIVLSKCFPISTGAGLHRNRLGSRRHSIINRYKLSSEYTIVGDRYVTTVPVSIYSGICCSLISKLFKSTETNGEPKAVFV